MDYRRRYVPGGTYFFTVVAYRRRPIFHNELAVTLLQRSVRDEKAARPFHMDAWVVLPDHVHMVWRMPLGDDDYSTRWASIKGRFTRWYLAAGRGEAALSPSRQEEGRRGVWQPRFFEHAVRDEDDFIQHVEYVHYNPVKHGLVKCPGQWKYSSFHEYVRRGIYEQRWGCGSRTFKAPSLAYDGGE